MVVHYSFKISSQNMKFLSKLARSASARRAAAANPVASVLNLLISFSSRPSTTSYHKQDEEDQLRRFSTGGRPNNCKNQTKKPDDGGGDDDGGSDDDGGADDPFDLSDLRGSLETQMIRRFYKNMRRKGKIPHWEKDKEEKK